MVVDEAISYFPEGYCSDNVYLVETFVCGCKEYRVFIVLATMREKLQKCSLHTQYRSLLPMYYRKAAAAIIVYDITREKTFEAVQNWITELHDLTSQKIVLAVAGNKCDLEDKRKVPGVSHCGMCTCS